MDSVLFTCAQYIEFIKRILERQVKSIGASMLSFELSATDLVLVIAVIVLLILYVKKSSTEPPTEEKRFVGEKIPPEKSGIEAANLKIEGERQFPPHARKVSSKCPYGFGYLKKLDKAAPIPEGCLSCSMIMECYGSGE